MDNELLKATGAEDLQGQFQNAFGDKLRGVLKKNNQPAKPTAPVAKAPATQPKSIVSGLKSVATAFKPVAKPAPAKPQGTTAIGNIINNISKGKQSQIVKHQQKQAERPVEQPKPILKSEVQPTAQPASEIPQTGSGVAPTKEQPGIIDTIKNALTPDDKKEETASQQPEGAIPGGGGGVGAVEEQPTDEGQPVAAWYQNPTYLVIGAIAIVGGWFVWKKYKK
jgi:hypothetical protein